MTQHDIQLIERINRLAAHILDEQQELAELQIEHMQHHGFLPCANMTLPIGTPKYPYMSPAQF